MFACSVCKFRSFYKEEMETHLESRFHKDHFKFLSGQLSKPTTDFLEVTQICEILYWDLMFLFSNCCIERHGILSFIFLL